MEDDLKNKNKMEDDLNLFLKNQKDDLKKKWNT